jgi:hypothetical protein
MQTFNFGTMQQQLASTVWVMSAGTYCESIRGDMNSIEPHFAINHTGIRIHQLHHAPTQAFHFASEQHNASLNYIENLVVVPRLAIGRQIGIGALCHMGTEAYR